MSTHPAPPSPRAGSRFELLIAMLAAVCGAVVTGVLDVMGVSGWGKLIGLACGAALPPFVAMVGSRRRLRATAAVLLSVVAIVIAYSGLLGVAVVSDQKPVVPTPNEISKIIAPGPSINTTEGAFGISTYPNEVQCNKNGCDEVTVESTGTAQLRVTSLEITGDAADFVTAAGCSNARLDQGEECTINLTFNPSGAPDPLSGTLVINQNLRGPATKVPVTAKGGTDGRNVNLALKSEGVVCRLGSDGVLTVRLPMQNTGLNAEVPNSIPVLAVVNDGTTATLTANPNTQIVTGLFKVEDPTTATRAKFQIDPHNQVAETSDNDNFTECGLT
jgi:type II secretory pathway pseudopilin PulG